MSISCRNSSTRKWRHCNFLHSVRCSPSLPRYTQILKVSKLLRAPLGGDTTSIELQSVAERSSSLPRLAPALGILVFRAASADLDVKVVTVNDSFRALDYMVYQLNTTEFASLDPWTFFSRGLND